MVSSGLLAEFGRPEFFVLRTPLLPFDALTSPAGRGAGRDRLRALLARPEVREAVYIASPSLHGRLTAWEDNPDSDAGRKVELALTRYLARMAGRATPFGLFAGCSVGAISRETRLLVGPARRHTRLDMDYIVALADALDRDPRLRPALHYTTNSSLYRVAGRARYLEVRRTSGGRSHHRASLAVSEYLDAVLSRAARGATPDELARVLLHHDPEATANEAAEYVAELIEHQVLVSELAPTVTGCEPIHGLIERLEQLPVPAAVEAAKTLTAVRNDLEALDTLGLGASPDRYDAIRARLAGLPTEVDPSRLFQVDLVWPAGEATLGDNIVAELSRGVELLHRLTPPPPNEPLTAFRRAFDARFGDTPISREVPLAEALDDETGVGFGDDGALVEASTLLEGLDIPARSEHQMTWGPRETYLLGRLSETLTTGNLELVLSDRDIEQLATADQPPLPDSFAVLARLESASAVAAARGDFRIYLSSAVGPSGARLLGRFCHGDPDLAAAVAETLRSEEALRPDAVFAEVVHLPEGRLGNILARPAWRACEISYLGRPGVPADRQLPLDDLRVSVNRSRVVLRSARLGREVVPRLTSAHNFGTGHGIYRFLCTLQSQGVASGLGWDWGPLAGSAFLPRVVHGRLILSRARWRVNREEAARLRSTSERERPAVIEHWRRERRLPRWVCLTESDNELPIDLNDEAMVAVLISELRDDQPATLTELFPAPDRLCAHGPEGRHVHELVVPFVRRARTPARADVGRNGSLLAPAPAALPSCRRTFPPGSEWLTIKLYAGPLVIDQIVRDVIGPLAIELVAEARARLWFFVRYADPHWHLRLRLAGEAGRLEADVLPRLRSAVAPFVNDGRIWKVQLDTYEREIERYGGPDGINYCEKLFHFDSEAVVELLRLPDDDPRGDRRWRLALLGMDRLLDDLALDSEGKRRVLRRARDGLRQELRLDGPAAGRLGAKYRKVSSSLSALLGTAPGPEWSAAQAVLQRRSRSARPETGQLRINKTLGQLTTELDDITGSLLHMHANRLLRSAHKLQEAVLYDFLFRHEDGLLARNQPGRSVRLQPI